MEKGKYIFFLGKKEHTISNNMFYFSSCWQGFLHLDNRSTAQTIIHIIFFKTIKIIQTVTATVY